jgi:hypothetical protein
MRDVESRLGAKFAIDEQVVAAIANFRRLAASENSDDQYSLTLCSVDYALAPEHLSLGLSDVQSLNNKDSFSIDGAVVWLDLAEHVRLNGKTLRWSDGIRVFE